MSWKENFIISLKDKRYTKGNPQLRPLSGKFVEYLAGLTLKGIANTATYSSAMELIAQVSKIAVELAADDVLTKMNCLGQLKVIAQSLPTYYNQTFAEDYQSGQKSLEVTKYLPQYQTLSTWRITKINLLANDTVAGKQVFINDGNDVTTLTTDIEAGKVATIDLTNPEDGTLGYVVKHPQKFSVSWDTSDVRPASWTWAANDMNNKQGCGCSGSAASLANIVGRWYFVSGSNSGISLDLLYFCDFKRMEQNIALAMPQAILYKFGALICEEIIASDRINFFVNNSLEWAEKKKTEWESLYEKELQKVLPSISQIARSVDTNCFTVRRNVFQEMRV